MKRRATSKALPDLAAEHGISTTDIQALSARFGSDPAHSPSSPSRSQVSMAAVPQIATSEFLVGAFRRAGQSHDSHAKQRAPA